MNPTIVYQDEVLLVINKPVGMVVNRAETVKTETVQDWVERMYPECYPSGTRSDQETEFLARSGIVHRIDKETSGLLIIAKTRDAFVDLQRQFREHTVKKTYLALVHGLVPQEGEIRAPVGRLPWNREQFGIVPGGKDSVTRFLRDRTFERTVDGKKETISAVFAYPETGRTHQIRVHFKYLGYPLVGDYLYGGRKQARSDRRGMGRVMLHAYRISFIHPQTGSPLALEAPIPEDMIMAGESGPVAE